jgi:hypothetical protein
MNKETWFAAFISIGALTCAGILLLLDYNGGHP